MKNEIEILMSDGCTKSEAKKHLKNGTIVFENPQDWFEDLEEKGLREEKDTLENARTGKLKDISVVNYEGHEYLIVYFL